MVENPSRRASPILPLGRSRTQQKKKPDDRSSPSRRKTDLGVENPGSRQGLRTYGRTLRIRRDCWISSGMSPFRYLHDLRQLTPLETKRRRSGSMNKFDAPSEPGHRADWKADLPMLLSPDYAYPITLNTSVAFRGSQNSVYAILSIPAQSFPYPKAAFSVSQ